MDQVIPCTPDDVPECSFVDNVLRVKKLLEGVSSESDFFRFSFSAAAFCSLSRAGDSASAVWTAPRKAALWSFRSRSAFLLCASVLFKLHVLAPQFDDLSLRVFPALFERCDLFLEPLDIVAMCIALSLGLRLFLA
jgi:hypothetical protein